MSLTLLMLSSIAFGEPKVQMRVGDRSVTGQSIELTVRITNPDSDAVAIPDLSNRPWLIQFQTVDTLGTKRTLHSTPPAIDPGTTHKIAPGQMRETRFEVPTSATWPPGTAEISLLFQGKTIGKRSVTLIALPSKAEADNAQPVDQTRGKSPHLWGIHRGDLTDLYLGHGSRIEYLNSVPNRVQPQLSVSRVEQHIGRWITWIDETDGALWAVQKDAHGLQGSPVSVGLPWPGSTPCGRSATDHAGRLVVPICVPSPNGENSQLVIAVYSNHASVQFRKVAPFKPTFVLTNVDSSGSVEFVLIRPTAVDWAPMGADTPLAGRPVPIEPIWRSQGSERITSASLRMSDEQPPRPEVLFSLDDGSQPISRPFSRR